MLDPLFQDLLDKGLLEPTSGSARDQLDARRRLINRSRSSPRLSTTAFLSRYDALMRTVEARLALSGLRFGDRPHLAMKATVLLMCEHLTREDLDSLSSRRHSVKKSGASPSDADVALLDLICSSIDTCPEIRDLLD